MEFCSSTYAAGNRRRSPDGFPVYPRGRNRHCHLAAGTGFHDRRQGAVNGRDDEGPRPGAGGKQILFQEPGHKIFGKSHIDEIAGEHGLKVPEKLPIDPKIPAVCDAGTIEQIDGNWFDAAGQLLAGQNN